MIKLYTNDSLQIKSAITNTKLRYNVFINKNVLSGGITTTYGEIYHYTESTNYIEAVILTVTNFSNTDADISVIIKNGTDVIEPFAFTVKGYSIYKITSGGNVVEYGPDGEWTVTNTNSGNSGGGGVSGTVTHIGDVTGETTLTLDKAAILSKSAATIEGGDYMLISDTSDSGNLKKVEFETPKSQLFKDILKIAFLKS